MRVPNGRRGTFAPRDIRHTLDLAGQGATAIEQALLFSKVRSYAKEVEVSYDSTLKALVAALDAKDEVTEGHGERVAKLTSHLARQMGVAEKAIVDMERGALLHDVGKIGVPDAVLNKPAALNDMEWEAMRKHPLLAGMMIAKVGFLEGATPILLYHHERWDGTGYPFGLAKTNIPFDARIFSVVDAYGAMTSDRPYRDAKSHDEAMAEIAAGSGTQFDPGVVIAFERLHIGAPELRTRPAAARKTRHAADFSAQPTPPTPARRRGRLEASVHSRARSVSHSGTPLARNWRTTFAAPRSNGSSQRKRRYAAYRNCARHSRACGTTIAAWTRCGGTSFGKSGSGSGSASGRWRSAPACRGRASAPTRPAGAVRRVRG